MTTQLLLGQNIPAEYKKFADKADSLLHSKDYKNSALNYSSAFKTLGWRGTHYDRYNAARAWTLANTADSAFFCLERLAYKAGYADYDKIVSEADFTLLHADKRWQPLLEQIKRNKLPDDWFRGGSKPTSYQMFLDAGTEQKKKDVLIIKSTEEKIDGFGTLMRNISPEKYAGKRIRMKGMMKSKDVAGWAGFWFRVDQENSTHSLAFDNMQDRAIKGTTEWNTYEVVLDVPAIASNIAFGALLVGTGQICFDKVAFEEVSKSVPVTGRK
jgi:hypothetical protein